MCFLWQNEVRQEIWIDSFGAGIIGTNALRYLTTLGVRTLAGVAKAAYDDVVTLFLGGDLNPVQRPRRTHQRARYRVRAYVR